MRRSAGIAATLLLAATSISCRIYLPFRFQLTPRLADEASRLRGAAPGPIALQWDPASFPQRVDVQGAAGFTGSLSRTRIPTGVAISTKVREFLEAAVGVGEGAPRVVTIRVVEARSSFEFGGRKRGGIDRARCTLKVEVQVEAPGARSRWSEAYFASDEPGGDPPTLTGVIDGVWDEVSSALARDVLRHLAEPPKPS